MEKFYIKAFLENNVENEGENWKEIVRRISAFLLDKSISENISEVLKKISSLKKVQKTKKLPMDFEEAEEAKESLEEINKELNEYKNFREINEGKKIINCQMLLDLLKFENVFDLFETEMNAGFKLKIIREKFINLKNKLEQMDEVKGIELLENKFKSTLAEMHLKRYIFKMQKLEIYKYETLFCVSISDVLKIHRNYVL